MHGKDPSIELDDEDAIDVFLADWIETCHDGTVVLKGPAWQFSEALRSLLLDVEDTCALPETKEVREMYQVLYDSEENNDVL